ncbi:MAG: serine O-acetyltransferase [Alphaproteobacteria bacterium]
MEKRAAKIAIHDPIWLTVRNEAADMAAQEPTLASFLHATILNHDRFEGALSFHLAQKLGSSEASPMLLRQPFDEAMSADPDIGNAVRADLMAVRERDPACQWLIQPLLYFKGFQALQAYRVAHWMWTNGRRPMALFLQARTSEVFGADIHPAARLGRGIMIDHATSVVIGETAVVEDDVSMLHEVTLGGTGKETGDRHPKVRRGAMLGAGAKLLGNIEIGEYSRVGAGSVVLENVPRCVTVAGVPAKIVGSAGCEQPAREMDQMFTDAGGI